MKTSRSRSRAMRRQVMAIRLYVGLLVAILSLSVTALLSQTALATTYVITDGDRVVTYTTFCEDPVQILDQAGMDMGEFDTYATEACPEGETITISRGQKITISYHGQTIKAASQGETAGELLRRLQLDVAGEDVVSHDLNTMTWDGMVLSVDRVETIREIYASTMPHAVSHCRDASLPAGREEILRQGQDGELLCTADVTYVNGRERSREVLSETVTKQPVTEVVGIGTGEAEAEEKGLRMEDGYITLPTGEVLTYTHTETVRATAYTHMDKGCGLVTATGTDVRWGTVAVDPAFIPYGTRMFIVSEDGDFVYGLATAEDCGGDIRGDRVDLYMPSFEQCMEFGRQNCTVYFLK
ncbi:MAG: G5 domain-containing protein [Oscillospiraceae bacterium]|nr:G5 domain-containing protein [Oscillospiraceae bacterium]MBQ3193694.1 G5 domain-containing protein [Oscillospiraceae bacterium]MBQ7129442.1 G5 domain-containing protein [Oscillospiraceae bacterium]